MIPRFQVQMMGAVKHLQKVSKQVGKTKQWAGKKAANMSKTQGKIVLRKAWGVPDKYAQSRFFATGGYGLSPVPYVVFRYENLNVGGTKKYPAVSTNYRITPTGKRGKGHASLKALKGSYPRSFLYGGTSKSGKKFTSPTVYQRAGNKSKPFAVVQIQTTDRTREDVIKAIRSTAEVVFKKEFERVWKIKVSGAV